MSVSVVSFRSYSPRAKHVLLE